MWLNSRHTPAELTGQLEAIKSGSAAPGSIEKVAAELAKLRKEYSGAIAFLPSYDQRQVDKVSSWGGVVIVVFKSR